MIEGNIMKETFVKVKYLDASVIAKLFLDEEGSSKFRDYFYNDTNYCTTFMTYYETMSVLKSRLFRGSNKDVYYHAIEKLAIHGWGGKIELESIELNDINIFKNINSLSMRYNLDVADAIQIYAILNGKYRFLAHEGASVLITADSNLAGAARTNNIRVWNVIKEERPEWLNG